MNFTETFNKDGLIQSRVYNDGGAGVYDWEYHTDGGYTITQTKNGDTRTWTHDKNTTLISRTSFKDVNGKKFVFKYDELEGIKSIINF